MTGSAYGVRPLGNRPLGNHGHVYWCGMISDRQSTDFKSVLRTGDEKSADSGRVGAWGRGCELRVCENYFLRFSSSRFLASAMTSSATFFGQGA